ncbi:MAG: beta-N-acetylhexosaminidase [Betaproteobacteria bacterium]|nr:beta-N-acetylhexosaminidase [Betaproteobacteria bacterium]
MALELSLGNVMLDVLGTELTAEDVRRLTHPSVGGVILFARNYRDPVQLHTLTNDIRALREPRLLIAVDHEGGRVQRFRSGFRAIPPMRRLGDLWERDPSQARRCAFHIGSVIALELAAHGVDFSFTPVLDLDYGQSGVIGDRAFHSDPDAVSELAGALIDGLHENGVIAVGKHFPGHGFCAADSHSAVPSDDRDLAQIEAADLVPFAKLARGQLDAIMPAHVIYSRVDANTAGFSRHWLQEILRKKYGFRGVIFSDDLSMEGASVAGGVAERAQAALHAGCDLALLCNQPEAADTLLAGLALSPKPGWSTRIEALKARPVVAHPKDLPENLAYRKAVSEIALLA